MREIIDRVRQIPAVDPLSAREIEEIIHQVRAREAVRAVLDTNIVVSALLFGGIPLDIIDLAEASAIDLVTSPAALAELSSVLNRPRFSKWFRARGLEPAAALTRSRVGDGGRAKRSAAHLQRQCRQ